MKLYLSTTSPYARLCVIAALRTGQNDIKLQFVLPWQNPAELLAVNPYSQIPALTDKGGNIITETAIILSQLDPSFCSSGHNSSLIGYSFATINQAVRGFSIKNYGNHPFIERSFNALRLALPKAETLNPHSEQWGHIMLGNALNYVRMRTPDIYESSVSADNKVALSEFLKRDFMVKTEQSAFEKYPKTIGDL